MTFSVITGEAASAGSGKLRKGPLTSALSPTPPAIIRASPRRILTPYPRTILGTWAGVTGHSPRRVVMREAATLLQGSMSHLRDCLAALDGAGPPLSGSGHAPEQGTRRVGGNTGRSHGSIQMRIVLPLPRQQGPPLELPRRSQNPHLRQWPAFQGPCPDLPGLCGFWTPLRNLAGVHLAPSVRIKAQSWRWPARPASREPAASPGHGPVASAEPPRPLAALDLPQGWDSGSATDLHIPRPPPPRTPRAMPCDRARRPSQPVPGQPARRRGRLDGRPAERAPGRQAGQRQSASEREKLRMRTLARALHELRRFLPPSVAPAA